MRRPPEQGASQIADAAKDCSREGLQSRELADAVLRLVVVEVVQSSGHARHQATDEEGVEDDPVQVDAHQGGDLGVLGHRPDAATELGSGHQPVEADHHEHCRSRSPGRRRRSPGPRPR